VLNVLEGSKIASADRQPPLRTASLRLDGTNQWSCAERGAILDGAANLDAVSDVPFCGKTRLVDQLRSVETERAGVKDAAPIPDLPDLFARRRFERKFCN